MLAYGEAKRGKYGAEMIHPEYRVQGDLSTPELQETLTPVYPTTEGVKQATLRKLTDGRWICSTHAPLKNSCRRNCHKE